MFPKISELVKETKEEEGDKYIFGVYTKWEEFKEKTSRGNVKVDVEYLRRHHNQKYLEKVYGKEKTATEAEGKEEEEEVFFVDVGCDGQFDVSILFSIRCNTVIHPSIRPSVHPSIYSSRCTCRLSIITPPLCTMQSYCVFT